MSSHFETKKPLPADLIKKIVDRFVPLYPSSSDYNTVVPCTSRYVNVGLFYLRQMFFAKLDLKMHTDQGMFIKKYLSLVITSSC